MLIIGKDYLPIINVLHFDIFLLIVQAPNMIILRREYNMGKLWHWFFVSCIFMVFSDVELSPKDSDNWLELSFPSGQETALLDVTWSDMSGLSLDFSNPFTAESKEEQYAADYESDKEKEEQDNISEGSLNSEFRYRDRIF